MATDQRNPYRNQYRLQPHLWDFVPMGLQSCWGLLGETPLNQGFPSISSGGYHACALDSNGHPVCWGIDL